MLQRELGPAGPRVRLAVLTRVANSWLELHDGAEPDVEVGRELAFRTTATGGTVYFLVLARDGSGRLRPLIPRIATITAGHTSTVGARRRFTVSVTDVELLVVLGARRQDIAGLLEDPGATLPRGRASAVLRLPVRAPERAAIPTAVPNHSGRASRPRTPPAPRPRMRSTLGGSGPADRQFDAMLPESAGPGLMIVHRESMSRAGPGFAGSGVRRRPARPAPSRSRRPAPSTRAAPSTTRRPAPRTRKPRTRQAFGQLEAPDVVAAGQEFEVVVGIAAKSVAGATGGALTLPDPESNPYALDILLIAEGFRLRRGEKWRNALSVSESDPFPSITLHLTTRATEYRTGAHTIQVLYSVGGAGVGLAVRPIAVLPAGSAPADRPTGTPTHTAPLGNPAAHGQPDLEIRILSDPALPAGTLIWDVDSKHPTVPRPAAPELRNIGSEPGVFASAMISDIEHETDPKTLYDRLIGFGRKIAEKVPVFVTDALTAAAAAIGGQVPSVLILSAEPYIPWELAVLEPPLDSATPPFLGAQAAVGRWVLQERPPPVQPPPSQLRVTGFGVVTGSYDEPLVHADKEATELIQAYGATKIAPEIARIRSVSNGDRAPEVLHFAVHGRFDAYATSSGGLILSNVDREEVILDSGVVDGWTLRPSLVFMNACQVGSGNALLGSYSGMASAFLGVGATAVVAPLWKIDDQRAGEIAHRFYQRALSGVPLGEAIRQERARYSADESETETLLAYQFFGHPLLTLDNKLTKRRRRTR